jgi:hypothetical protein
LNFRILTPQPRGLLGRAVHALTNRASVNANFDFRSAKVRELFGCDASLQGQRS